MPAPHKGVAGGEFGANPLKTGRIQSLARMDAILQAIIDLGGKSSRLTDIAAATALHKSTVFSLLETLILLGYAARGKERGYTIGPRLFELGKQAEKRLDVIQLARPIMYDIVDHSGESVTLALPSSFDAVAVCTIEGTFAVRGARWEGLHVPYHASAVGKAILAFMPEDVQRSLLARLRLQRHTRRTITDRQRLEAELEEIRKVGFAFSLEEEEHGSNAVAAPILDRMDKVVGALAVWGPAPRLTRSHLVALGARIATACCGLSGKLPV